MSKPAANYCLRCGSRLHQGSENGEPRLVCSSSTCPWVFYNNPTPVVAAVVEQPDSDDPNASSSVLLVQSIGWPRHFFSLVTGFLEAGERVSDAVVREVKEELGLDSRVVDFLGVFDFVRLNQIIIAYHVRAEPGQPVVLQTSELADWRRIPTHRLKSFPGPTGEAIAVFLKRRAAKLRQSKL